MKPHLAFAVENKLSEDPDAGKIEVDLHFKSMDDFEPANVARQVKPLKELLELRTETLRSAWQPAGQRQAGGDPAARLVGNTEKLDKLKAEMEGGGQWLIHNRQYRNRLPRTTTGKRSCSTDRRGRTLGERRFRAASAGKDMIKEFVKEVLDGHHDHRPGHGRDDQCAHRADRSPGLHPVERSAARTRSSRSWKAPGAVCSI